MGYIGLSLLVVSISFFCYRHPPASWILPDWFHRSSIRGIGRGDLKKEKDAPGRNTSHERGEELKAIPKITQNDTNVPTIVHSEEESPREKADIPTFTHEAPPADLDRKAMPPPPPPSFKKAASKPAVPLFTTTPSPSDSTPKPPVPLFATTPSSSSSTTSSPPKAMFPALNSHQRASSGTNAPQRLPPPPSFTSNSNNLMAPPTRPISSLPNRGPPSTHSTSSSLFPPASHTSVPTKPSKKVLLSPGRSPLDWARLTSSPSFTSTYSSRPYIRVPPSLLRQHNGRKGKDAWTVLGGKVYDITPYMEYHPGGIPELMKCAGREGTRLFGEVHPWVNWEGMLEGCLVGLAVEEEKGGSTKGGGLEEMD